jgi:aminopeptidase YwaD
MGFQKRFFTVLLVLPLPLLLTSDGGMISVTGAISIEELKRHVRNIHFDRNPFDCFQALERAAEYIRQEFSKAGFSAQNELVRWEGKEFHNVVVEKKGTISPERVVILGAHYDTVPGSPGADDNASAVAVLLEVARSMRAIPLRSTIRFIAFTLEEYGYVGSTQHARKARKDGEEIVGMISLEMVGFTAPRQSYPHYIDTRNYPIAGNFIGILSNTRSENLLGKVRQSLKTHAPELPAEFLIVPGNGEGLEAVRLSDHSSFWDENYPALMVTDTAFLRNPNYHLPTDTLETLDFEFMGKVAIGIYHSMVELTK